MKCVLHNKNVSSLCYGIHKNESDFCADDCHWREDNYIKKYEDVISHKI